MTDTTEANDVEKPGGEQTRCSSHCSDSARKEIEQHRQLRVDEQGDYANGYYDGCDFAIRVLEDHTSNTENQRSVDRVLDRISMMEKQIATVELLTDPRLSEMYERWKETLNEAWEVINEQAR